MTAEQMGKALLASIAARLAANEVITQQLRAGDPDRLRTGFGYGEGYAIALLGTQAWVEAWLASARGTASTPASDEQEGVWA